MSLADKQFVMDERPTDRYSDSILVVDDDPQFLSIVTSTLARAGHKYVVAMTGAHALELLASRRFSVVLLDIVLPDTNGLSILQAVSQAGDDVPVVVTSGHARAGHGFEAGRKGALAFLEKPFRMGVFLELISTISVPTGRLPIDLPAGEPTDATASRDSNRSETAADRLARILVRASLEAEDFKTGLGLARIGGISYGTLRHWCAELQVPGRTLVRFGRALWAIRFSQKCQLPPRDVLDVIGRTSKRLILGDLYELRSVTPADFYRRQRHLPPESAVLEACLRTDPDTATRA